MKQTGEWGDKDGGWTGPDDVVLDSRPQGLGPVQRALGSQGDFKQGKDRVRFCFRKILLAAMWWVDQRRTKAGWKPRGSWGRKSPKGGAVGKEGGSWQKGQSEG